MGIPLDAALNWVAEYRYLVLLPIMIVEGPIITVIAGLLVSLGQLNFGVAYGILVAGDVIGDSIYYYAGRWGKQPFGGRLGRWLGITPDRIRSLESFFERHRVKTLLMGKWSHAVGAPILVAAGVARVPYAEFLAINFIATLPKTFALLLIGFYFGKSYATIAHYMDVVAIGTIALAMAAGALLVLRSRRRKSKSEYRGSGR